MHGGKRSGSGRKKGSKADRAAIDIAGKVLRQINAEEHWKALLTCGDNKVIADVMKYLTNRAFGMPKQPVDQNHSGEVIFKWQG